MSTAKPNEKIQAYGGIEIDRKVLEEACRELARSVIVVEALLEEIKSDPAKAHNLARIAERLNTIKANGRQMNLGQLADLSEVAEELAVKGAQATKRHVVRKVVGALWDAVTTLYHMLDQVKTDTSGEGEILLQRLQSALDSLGGAREKVSQDEIDQLVGKRQ